MSVPIALHLFYDDLLRHDWQHEKSDDHSVWQKGQSEQFRLEDLAKTSPEHQALFRAVEKYHLGPSGTDKPDRPVDNAPFTLPPPRPASNELMDLSPEDRASVQASPQPAKRLQEIYQRLELDQKIPFDQVLHAFGAIQNEQSPARWTFPDGAVAMVKLDRKAWVEQKTLITGQGPIALISRLKNLTETQAIAALSALTVDGTLIQGNVMPGGAAGESHAHASPLSANPPASPPVEPPMPPTSVRRFVRRQR
jgi:hypothetical protein